MITFDVDSDKVNTEPAILDDWLSKPDQKERVLKKGYTKLGIKEGSIEAYKFNAPLDDLVILPSSMNSFLDTCNTAFNDHVPLVLGPDEVWITMARAVAQHINLNPEDCRKALVSWEGKQRLVVQADHFKKGSPLNDWEWAFQQFGAQIEGFIGKKRDMFDPTFSTTSATEKAAIQVQMMDALSSYFEYGMRTCCGIPQVTLLGEIDDWSSILARVNAFGEFYPKWAHEPLQYVAAEFVKAAAGKPDLQFWRNFVKVSGGSGGPFVSGFINALFPYTGKGTPNNMLKNDKPFYDAVMTRSWGPALGDFPASVCAVDMDWDYYGQIFNMKLTAGVFGMAIHHGVHAKGGLRPLVGWAVGESNAEK